MSSATASYVDGNDDAAYTDIVYRFNTNFCMLCDSRCIQCTGPLNTECGMCRDTYYKWTTHTNCLPYCPTVAITDAVNNWAWTSDTRGQWKNSVNTCSDCNAMCSFCNGAAATDCFSCVTGNVLVDDQTTCTTIFSTSGFGP